MPLADFIIQTNAGLYCRYGNFYLDPQQAVARAVISHAHGDHAVSGHQEVYCTEPTRAFMEQRYRKFAAQQFETYAYGRTFRLNDVDITFFSAGHILGSALIHMAYKGCTYLYTGDYKRETDATSAPFHQGVTADVLITETTFAYPELEHPDAKSEIQKLTKIDANIMLGAYALGKSQRLISLINAYCPEKKVLLHHSIVPFTKIYEQFDMPVGHYQPYDRKVMKTGNNLIYIVPPMVFHSYFKALHVVRIFASGWKHLQQDAERSLFISDHVDWPGILRTIKEVNPQEIWTVHGEGKHLKNSFEGQIPVKTLHLVKP